MRKYPNKSKSRMFFIIKKNEQIGMILNA